jgi:hypothetical protein
MALKPPSKQFRSGKKRNDYNGLGLVGLQKGVLVGVLVEKLHRS